MAGISPAGGPFQDSPTEKRRLEETQDDKLGSSPADSITDEESRPARNGHYGSTEDHVFSDPSVADYWRKVYEQAGYENRHRFDPTLEWTAEEERKLVKKVRSLQPDRHDLP